MNRLKTARRWKVRLGKKSTGIGIAFGLAWVISSYYLGMEYFSFVSSSSSSSSPSSLSDVPLWQWYHSNVVPWNYYNDNANASASSNGSDIHSHQTNSIGWKSNTNSAIPFELSQRQRPQNYTALVSMYGPHRVQDSMAKLPEWLQQYFSWHAEQRKNESDDTKYLVIGCFVKDKCGGTSDRLRGLMYYLYIAYLSERVLVIKWTKPHDLSEYLMPAGDVDWRAPAEMNSLIMHNMNQHRQQKLNVIYGGYCLPHYSATVRECTEYISKKLKESKHKYHLLGMYTKGHDTINVVNQFTQAISYQDQDKMPCLNQWKYPDIFGDIFRVMFEPVPELARQINETMKTLGLVENQYVSVHVRARYPVSRSVGVSRAWDKIGGFDFYHERMHAYLVGIATNAFDCSNKLQDIVYPTFFSSDSHEYTNFLLNTTNWKNGKAPEKVLNVTIRAISRNEEPPHLDRDDGWPGSDPSFFFTVFEDLLIMGGSRCVTHGMGSFGAFGAGLTGNLCRAIHRRYDGRSVHCPNDRAYNNITCDVDNGQYDDLFSWNGGKMPYPRLVTN